ncbi:MAG: UDP-N-acetylmuramate:L-alanyl-gamma-D-glutamyl-meso-diaminopimelate ligase [Polyangiaceae bacterium]|nr:UDP-N-acetylmuramate:L-alanyl-gamma-D-glutamyl-meso-diaminopimelate ligase [Polyangiaceae bacterium]
MHIHVVGVSGTGMGALAGLLAELGHEVSGSDVSFDPPIGPALQSWGVRCLLGYEARHLEPAPDLVVIGNVCRRDNAEARAAIDQGLRYTHIAGALAEFALPGSSSLVVAGTHGKTTTTSMAAWLLETAGFGPGFLIGGVPKNFGRSFRAPGREPARAQTGPARRARPFVLEGDEYDTAFFEKTAKFLHYGAEVAVITSIEYDHIDIYPSFELYLEAFRAFVATVPGHGLIVANSSDAHVAALVSENARAPVAWYGLEGDPVRGGPPGWLCAPGEVSGAATAFDLYVGGDAAGRWLLPATGRHNLANATAAIAAVVQGYGAPLGALRAGLGQFAGVRRRQDLLGNPGGVLVYDDFAHHPTAVRETLRALRQRHPGAKILCVFEPRSATACRQLHQQDYPPSFKDADEVLLAPLGRSGLPPDEQLDLDALCGDLERRGTPAHRFTSIERIVDAIAARAAPGDVVALLSNGAFGGIHAKVLNRLAPQDAGQTLTNENGASS